MSLVSRSKASRRQRVEITPLLKLALPRPHFYQNLNLLTKLLAHIRRHQSVILAGGLFAGCLLGGGGGSFLSDPVLPLVSIPLLVFVLPNVTKEYPFAQNRLGWILCAGIVFLPFFQLIPLPPRIWTNLPGHDLIVANLKLLNDKLPWLPISVAPSSTWWAGLSLIPPLTIFLATVLLSSSERFRILVVLLIFSTMSVAIGVLQVAQGSDSPLYFFEVTNRGEAVGFFANRNHFAALLYCALVFLCPWVIDIGLDFRANQSNRAAAQVYLPILIGVTTLLLMFGAAEMITHSRAGLSLALIGGVASGASIVFDSRGASRIKFAKWSLLAIVAAALVMGDQGVQGIMERVTHAQQEVRLPLTRTTLSAALHYLPFGSGFGTFPSVYGIFERPTDLIPSTFVNRAHNDFAEIFLEAGVFGIGLALAFLVWFVQQSAQIWRHRSEASAKQEILMARSATIVISLLLLHSLVDYPLRTGAMMSILAVSCAFMMRPKTVDTAPSLATSAIAATGSRRQEGPVLQASTDVPWRSDPIKQMKSSVPKTQLREEDHRNPPLEKIEWPEAWQNK